MLKSIRLKNFKLHEDTSIEVAPITVFIGPNNSGKSSIFQALLALRQAAQLASNFLLQPTQRQSTSAGQPYLFDSAYLLDLGGFEDVLRHGEHEIVIGLKGDLGPSRQSRGDSIPEVEFEVAILDNELARHQGKMYISGAGPLTWKHITSAPGTFPKPYINVDNAQLEFTALPNVRLLSPDPPRPVPGLRPEMVDRLIEIGRSVAHAPADLLASVHPVSPLRGFEEWGYPLPDERAQHLDRLSLPDRAVALIATIAANARLKKELSDRLLEMLGIGVDIEYLGSNRVKLFATEETRGRRQRLFVNEGTGATQLPFILVPIAVTPKNETVLLAEPEAHLHPKAQCELTRMLLTIAKKENIQFFIETHSEHVLHVILNAIGKREWEPSQIAIYSFENINGTAKATRLEVDEQGGVKGGLPGFFDQSLDELTEYLETLKKPST